MVDLPADPKAVVDGDDDEFLAALPDLLAAIDADLQGFLLQYPDGFEALVTRVGELEDPASAVDRNPESFELFVELVWRTLELVTAVLPAAAEAVTEDITAEWDCTDTGLRFHLEMDAAAGTVTGDAGPALEPDLAFIGDTETMLRMIADRDFDGQQAFMQGRFQIEGPLPLAVELADSTEAMVTAIEDLT